MTQVELYEFDSVIQIAEKIYKYFVVNQSCTIRGYIEIKGEICSRGEEVINILRQMDEKEHVISYGKKLKRNRKFLTNSIGGPVSQKIFRYTKRMDDRKLVISIWRHQ